MAAWANLVLSDGYHCQRQGCKFSLAFMAFSSEGSLICHICCDMWLPFKVMSKRLVILISRCQALAKELSITIYFNALALTWTTRPGSLKLKTCRLWALSPNHPLIKCIRAWSYKMHCQVNFRKCGVTIKLFLLFILNYYKSETSFRSNKTSTVPLQ
jgi:hypothetical protein